jgi:hypothetical protein
MEESMAVKFYTIGPDHETRPLVVVCMTAIDGGGDSNAYGRAVVAQGGKVTHAMEMHFSKSANIEGLAVQHSPELLCEAAAEHAYRVVASKDPTAAPWLLREASLQEVAAMVAKGYPMPIAQVRGYWHQNDFHEAMNQLGRMRQVEIKFEQVQ